MDITDPIYPGAFFSLVRHHDKKRRPFSNAAEILPKADIDLAPFLTKRVEIAPQPPGDDAKADLLKKRSRLTHEFQGQPEILLLHALLIAVLRRRNPPSQAVPLFIRIWSEHGRFLAGTITTRWKISATTTFADHGTTATQRSLGMGLSVLFDCIKLHDSERMRSGQPLDTPFPRQAHDQRQKLAFDMTHYSMTKGDMDRNMLARLWCLAEEDDVMFPLARDMLMQVMGDPRSIFARLQKIKPTRPETAPSDILDGDW